MDRARRDEAWSRPGPTAGHRPAPVDAFGEWLDGCDGSVLGRAAWSGAPHAFAAGLAHWRESAARRDVAVWTCAEVSAALLGDGGASLSTSFVLVDDGQGAPRAAASAWVRVGLRGLPVVGVVARDGPRVRWGCLPVAPGVALAASADRVADGCRAFEARPAASPLPVIAGGARRERWSPARVGWCLDRAREAEREADAASLKGRPRAAARAGRSAVEWWLGGGAVWRALRAAARLVGWRVAAGDVSRADALAACAEVAALIAGGPLHEVRRAAAGASRAREHAHRRAWAPVARLPTVPRGSRDGQQDGGTAVDEALIDVLQAGHHEDEYPAIARVCSVVRDRLGASAVAVVALGEPSPLAGAGATPYASDALLRRAVGTVAEIAPSRGQDGVEAAVPVRFAGAPVGVLCCRWGANARVDEQRARTLLAAAASVCAPNLHALLCRRPIRHDADETLGLLGVSPAIARVRDAIRRAAAVPFPVLVEGESGSGKELVARAVHQASARQRRQFCAVNCAAISDELFEAELFGHARGAFTGALAERAGLFEEADGGTLFLDEIGELSPRGQAKLLRVLQEGEVRRLGENLPRRVDARLVAATNRSLEHEAAAGRFRDDLRFRLDVVRIPLPPLRERRADVPMLAEHFWRQAISRTGGRARLDDTTLEVLSRHHWPGNVRELQNLMATLAVRAPARGRVRPSDLPLRLTSAPPEARSLGEARRDFDAVFVRATLERCGGQRAEAARRLGLSRQGLAKLIARLGLDTDPA